jgi:type I restriction enzyme S subunit
MGQSPPSSTYNDKGIGLPFFQGKADFGQVFPIPRYWCSKPGKIAQPGDVLMSVRAPVGPTNLADAESCIGRGLCAIRPLSDIPSFYVLRYLRLIEEQIAEMGQGSTFTAISRSDVETIQVPLAPLPEQLRIVDKIEALFEQSRTAREALDAIPALLRQFRQAVLAAAFRGELSTRDPNDEPASVLLERILKERRRRWEEDLRARGKDPRRYTYPEPAAPDTRDLPELPEGWCWTSVSEVARFIQYGYTANSSPDFSGPHYLRITDIQHDSVDWSSVPRCEIEEENLSKYLLKPGDIVFARSGATAGKSYLITDCPVAVFASYLIRVQLFPQIMPEYLYAFFRSGDYWDQIITRGNAQPNANAQVLGAVKFPLAPLSEQRQIVSRIQSLFTQADIVEGAAELARRRLDRLDQSILARAFRGELVPQDPNDEPASVLLERIRAERSRRVGERASRRKDKGRK